MKKSKLLILAFSTTLALVSCNMKPSEDTGDSLKTIESTETTASQKQKDLDRFTSSLEKGHKNMYANISKEVFDQETEKIMEQLDGMENSDFYYSLKHLASLIGDSHTSLDFHADKYSYLHGLPFAIKSYRDGWHLFMLEEKNEAYLGYILQSVNDVPMEQVVERADAIISSDNPVWRDAKLSDTINFQEALEYIGVVKKDAPIVLTIQNPDDSTDIQDLEITPMDASEIENSNILSLTPDQVPETAADGYYRSLPLTADCYFIQYNRCEENPDLTMKQFARTVTEDLAKGQYQKIILDFRYNTGGNSRVFDPLLKVLKEYCGTHEPDVYTLIGSKTFSSGIINAIQTKEQLGSILTGTPTGGSVNSYGELKSFTLKNIPVTVYYSTKYFELIPGYEGNSLQPESYAEESFQDYMEGVDRAVETVLSAPYLSAFR